MLQGKGMREEELRAAARCAVCEQPFGHAGLPLFWRMRLERHGVLANEVQRVDGLAAYIGSSKLANLMGTDPELTKPMMEPVEVTICEACSHTPIHIDLIAEAAADALKKRDGD